MFKVNNKNTTGVFIVNLFHPFFYCFYYWVRASKCYLGTDAKKTSLNIRCLTTFWSKKSVEKGSKKSYSSILFLINVEKNKSLGRDAYQSYVQYNVLNEWCLTDVWHRFLTFFLSSAKTRSRESSDFRKFEKWNMMIHVTLKISLSEFSAEEIPLYVWVNCANLFWIYNLDSSWFDLKLRNNRQRRI